MISNGTQTVNQTLHSVLLKCNKPLNYIQLSVWWNKSFLTLHLWVKLNPTSWISNSLIPPRGRERDQQLPVKRRTKPNLWGSKGSPLTEALLATGTESPVYFIQLILQEKHTRAGGAWSKPLIFKLHNTKQSWVLACSFHTDRPNTIGSDKLLLNTHPIIHSRKLEIIYY